MPRRSRITGRTRTGLTLRFPSEYLSWRGMRARCRYPKNPSYQYFGALGIRVCVRWIDSFDAFMHDMGPKPSRRHGISRRDAARNFSPENCFWATPSEQQINSTKAVFLEFLGQRLCLTEWAEKTGIAASVISTRIHKFGWTVEQALSIPPEKGANPVGDARRARRPKTPTLGPSKRNQSSGVCGVVWHKPNQKWQAVLRGMGTPIYCGHFTLKEDAIAAVEAKAKEIREKKVGVPEVESGTSTMST